MGYGQAFEFPQEQQVPIVFWYTFEQFVEAVPPRAVPFRYRVPIG
jgi:hypothetical protein